MTAASDIFLSYSRDDQAVARHFAEGFERAGLSVWWDVTLNAGEDYDRVTERALRDAKAVVVLWSAKSVESRWVRTEATIALQGKTLVPVTIEACQRPIMFELTQTADLCHWTGDSSDPVWLTFLSDVQRFVHRGASASAAVVSESATLTPPLPRRTPAPTKTVATTTRGPSQLAWGLFALSTLIAITLAVPTFQHLRETAPPPPPEARLDIVTPATDQPLSFALSPDGRQIVYVAADAEGVSRLWLRSLATTTAQPLTGTENGYLPFWSPDSRSIGFFTGNALRRLDLGGGAPQTLAPATNGSGGSWNADGTILFAPNVVSSLLRVSATAGGTATVQTTMQPQTQGHTYPNFLPDGNHFLFCVQGPPDTAGIYLGALDGMEPVKLTQSNSEGTYHPAGWVLWEREGALVAQRLDLAQSKLTGDTLTITEGTLSDSNFYRSPVSVAATGLIAYRTGTGSQRLLSWFDRAGNEQGTIGEPGISQQPRVLSDGRRVIVALEAERNRDLWLLDGARTTRLVTDAAEDWYPAVSHDDTRLAFRSLRAGASTLYELPVDGSRDEQNVVASSQGMTPQSWSPDGRYLMYTRSDSQTNADLWAVPMEGERTPFVFLRTPYREIGAEFSPDGRWVAYQSDESGQPEIYIRPFVPPDAGAAAGAADDQWQVSSAGGIYPRWSPDGTELYFLDPAGAMMAVPITASANTIEPGVPHMLFATPVFGGGVDRQQGREYDVAPDGRFLINTVLDDTDDPITLLLNWNP